MSKLRFQVIPVIISGSRLVSGGGIFPELHQHSNISFHFKYACIVHVYVVIHCYDSSWSFRVQVLLLFVYICSTVVDTGIKGEVRELEFNSNSTSLRKR